MHGPFNKYPRKIYGELQELFDKSSMQIIVTLVNICAEVLLFSKSNFDRPNKKFETRKLKNYIIAFISFYNVSKRNHFCR